MVCSRTSVTTMRAAIRVAIYDGRNDDVLFPPCAVLLRARVRTAKQVDTTGFWLCIDLNSR